MVFHGISGGCNTCLKRRIKCDESRPVCTRCTNSNRVCLGYRDATALMFRNQTVPKAPNPQLRVDTSASSSICDTLTSSANDSITLTSGLFANSGTSLLSWEEEAVEVLMSRMVVSSEQSDARQGPIAALPLLYSRSSKNSALHSAVLALALHIYPGNTTTRREVQPQVRIKYGQALEKVHRALLESSTAQSDEILMTILLFGIIESIMATNDSLPSIGAHSDAIKLLVQNRGKSIIRDQIGIGIFFGVRSQMAMNHALRSIPLSDLVDGKRICWDDVPVHIQTNPINRLTTASIPVANLRVLADEVLYEPRSETNIRPVQNLIEQCKATDRRLVEWHSTIPSSWACIIIEKEKMTYQNIGDLTFEPCSWLMQCRFYRDVWIAHMYNTFYVFRALLQSIILRCAVWMRGNAIADLKADDMGSTSCPLQLDSEALQARDDLLECFEAICSSVPFLFGATPNVELFPDLQLPFKCQTSELGPPLLVRPLFVANSVIVAPQYQRSWVESVLLEIGTSYGIGIARLMAEAKGLKARPLFLARPPLRLRTRSADVYDGVARSGPLKEPPDFWYGKGHFG